MDGMEGPHLQTDEDVEQILRLALRQSTGGSSLALRERLRASASELGISEEQLEAAERQYRATKERDREFEQYKREERNGFYGHLIPYVLVNIFLAAMAIGDHESWYIYPLFGWGIGLAIHAFAALNTKSAHFQKEFESWRAKKRFEREQARAADALDYSP